MAGNGREGNFWEGFRKGLNGKWLIGRDGKSK